MKNKHVGEHRALNAVQHMAGSIKEGECALAACREGLSNARETVDEHLANEVKLVATLASFKEALDILQIQEAKS